MDSSIVCIKTSWRRGYVHCNITSILCPYGRLPDGVCLHEIPSCLLPLSNAARQRICDDHAFGLRYPTFRCRADATSRLHRRLRARDLPVCVVTEPPGLLRHSVVGSSLHTSVADILVQLQRALPGEWTLRAAHAASKAVSVSYCPLNDVGDTLPPPPHGAEAWHLRATFEGSSTGDKRPDLGKSGKRRRLEKLASLVDPQSGAYNAERLAAERLLLRETLRAETQARSKPI